MGMPTQVETLVEMQRRFPAALEKVYCAEDVQRGGDRPGSQRKHIFDFEDGVRLCASRGYSECGCKFTQFSVSISEGALAERLAKEGIVLAVFAEAVRHWVMLSPNNRQICQLVHTERAVMHFVTEVTECSSCLEG